jgi:hypothetical protein
VRAAGPRAERADAGDPVAGLRASAARIGELPSTLARAMLTSLLSVVRGDSPPAFALVRALVPIPAGIATDEALPPSG